MNAATIEEEALALPLQERAKLVERLANRSNIDRRVEGH